VAEKEVNAKRGECQSMAGKDRKLTSALPRQIMPAIIRCNVQKFPGKIKRNVCRCVMPQILWVETVAQISCPMSLTFKEHHDRKMKVRKIFTAYCRLTEGFFL
jgi:hypothetical protein